VGPYELNWETQQYKCWISQIITFSLLACLQALNIFWLFLILRVLWNYIMTRNLVDETSDVEDEQADHESRDQVTQLPVQDTKEKR
jgi:acyl-CoA-dependent ceramide synthase